jgi:hypothetical protein
MFLRFTTILFFISYVSVGQQLIGRDLKDNLFIKASNPGSQRWENIEGSAFLDEKFITGDVIALNRKFEGIPMRYNIFDDNIEFKQNDGQFILLPEPRIQKVHIGEEIFIAEKHEVKGKPKVGFLMMIDSGKVILMRKKVVIFSPKSEPTALNPVSTPARFTRDQDLYFYKIGDEVKRITNLKSLIDGLPDKRDEVARFVKKEKVSVKNEVELIKIVRYYNSLR